MAATENVEELEFDYEALPSSYGLGRNMLAGAFAGIAEHSVMYPVDLLKTRMQILHPSTGGLYTGLTNAVSTIYRIEGWRTLWKGVSSVIVGAGPAHAVYFGTYEIVKEMAGGNVDDGHHPLAAALSGASATIASDALMNPFDVIKQRMQVHGSVHKSLLQCAKTLYRTEGLQAFYLSYPTTLCMTVPFTATQFVAYESLSKFMNPKQEYDPLTHCMAGGLAGAFAAGLTTPSRRREDTSPDPWSRRERGDPLCQGSLQCRLHYQAAIRLGWFPPWYATPDYFYHAQHGYLLDFL
ncbi:mitochondrial carrier [Penicillium frequentans]|nr:mitochondrial carrier [Penicillium glabrum]